MKKFLKIELFEKDIEHAKIKSLRKTTTENYIFLHFSRNAIVCLNSASVTVRIRHAFRKNFMPLSDVWWKHFEKLNCLKKICSTPNSEVVRETTTKVCDLKNKFGRNTIGWFEFSWIVTVGIWHWEKISCHNQMSDEKLLKLKFFSICCRRHGAYIEIAKITSLLNIFNKIILKKLILQKKFRANTIKIDSFEFRLCHSVGMSQTSKNSMPKSAVWWKISRLTITDSMSSVQHKLIYWSRPK